MRGRARTLLECERVALNFLQRLSGVATLARALRRRAWRDRLPRARHAQDHARACARLEKMAAAAGGVTNHRMGLYDAILIKNNHIAAAGGVRAGDRGARARPDLPIEIEVRTRDELERGAGARRRPPAARQPDARRSRRVDSATSPAAPQWSSPAASRWTRPRLRGDRRRFRFLGRHHAFGARQWISAFAWSCVTDGVRCRADRRAAICSGIESIDSTMREAVRLAAGCIARRNGCGSRRADAPARDATDARGTRSAMRGCMFDRAAAGNLDGGTPVVTLALGLATAMAIREVSGVDCDLRWPNDVISAIASARGF